MTGIAFALSERFKWSPVALIIGGAAVGMVRVLIGGFWKVAFMPDGVDGDSAPVVF